MVMYGNIDTPILCIDIQYLSIHLAYQHIQKSESQKWKVSLNVTGTLKVRLKEPPQTAHMVL